MSFYQYGEVFVIDDGVEIDLDLGYYECFIDINFNKYFNVIIGKIYSEVFCKECCGEYFGVIVQVIFYIIDVLKEKIKCAVLMIDFDVIIIEVGGIVGDIEFLLFLEVFCQMKVDVGVDNVMYIYIILFFYFKAVGEMKIKLI